ncbi:MAG: hypothetical protein V2B18_06325, partial [Pseudomonadota bacterium]
SEAMADAARFHTVYANQTLEAVAVSRARAADYEEAAELSALANLLIPAGDIHCIVCGRHPRDAMTQQDAAFWACDDCGGGDQ